MKGRYLNEGDITNRKKHVVIGRLVAEDLFQDEDPIGKYIFGSGHSWKVIGVFQDEGGDREERNLYVPYTSMQKIQKNNDEINQMIVIYDKNMSYNESLILEKDLESYIKEKKFISPDDNRGIYISNTGEQQENSRQFASVLSIIISFIGIGTLVAGIIGISNIMVFVVKERTKEIGIRKAIGATPNSIIAMVLQESIFITMISGYLGLVVALIILNGIGDNLMEKYFISNPYIQTSNAVWATIILIFFGALAGYLPARKAAKIKPIIALRDK
jgi:putative ABC transport system permease protein